MIYRVPTDTQMDAETLLKYITKHKEYVRKYVQPLYDAYLNKYRIFEEPKKMDGKPDNRIAVNYAKFITDTFNGFFIGNPVKVEADEEKVVDYVADLDAENDGDNLNAEVAKLADICGSSWEMYYNKEDGETGITYLSDLEAFMIVDDSILERPLYFVRYYKDAEGNEYGSYSDEKIVRHFYFKDGEYHLEDDEHPHGFAYVPAVEFMLNDERMGLFESALPAMNEYNKALSEKANDVDYFADAYLKILGATVNDGDTSYIRRTRLINFDGNTDENPITVEFMEKPSSDETQEHLLDRLKTDIFVTSMVANISDENFGTSSGIALRYKMEAMSNLFISKARRFTSSMLERYKIIFSSPVAQMHGVSKDAWKQIKVHYTPNYPANYESEANVAKSLEGIVSKETQLKVLSLVDDVKEEVEKLEAEQIPSVIDNIYGEYTGTMDTTE